MLEIILCSMVTILPDYLYRRYVQGKRFGKEITLYSVWFELRWGITSCLILTISLITLIFYNHPSTTDVAVLYRTVPILSEGSGRVSEVVAPFTGTVKQGDVLFRLDSSEQEAALATAQRKLAEVDAALAVAPLEVERAEGQLQDAQASLQQAIDELSTTQELNKRNSSIVSARELQRLDLSVASRRGGVAAAQAVKRTAEAQLSTLLPAQKASAVAALAQAQVELDKMVVRAGVSGHIEQFALRKGDIVNSFMRPAGILIPEGAGRRSIQAGFGQIEAQVLKPGMVAEVACVSKPWTIIPMVVTDVQDYIAAGQFRGGEQLLELQQVRQPGTLMAFLEPLYEGGLDGVTPGSSCVANAYSSNHDLMESPDIGALKKFGLHALDALGLVHAILLRIQAILLPFQTLVLSGGH
jgi:multidrug resistance efflux pump